MRLHTRLPVRQGDGTVQAAAALLRAADSEAARLGVLRIALDCLAAAAHALVSAVGAERGEDEELPDRAAVLGRVVMVAALPATVTSLRGQDARHGAMTHDGAPRRHDLSVARSCPQQFGEREVAHRGVITLKQPRDGVCGRHRSPVAHETSLRVLPDHDKGVHSVGRSGPWGSGLHIPNPPLRTRRRQHGLAFSRASVASQRGSATTRVTHMGPSHEIVASIRL
jgi:hypothetical protein